MTPTVVLLVKARGSWLVALCATALACEPDASRGDSSTPSAVPAVEQPPAIPEATVVPASEATPAVASGVETLPKLAPLLQGGCHHSLAFEAVGSERWVSESNKVHRFDAAGRSRGPRNLENLRVAAGGPIESVTAFGDTPLRPWIVAVQQEQGALVRALYRGTLDGPAQTIESLGRYGAVVAFGDSALVYDDLNASLGAHLVGAGATALYPAAEVDRSTCSGTVARLLDPQRLSDGTLAALTGCRDLWLSRWEPGGAVGEHTLLRRGVTQGSLVLQDTGLGYADVHDGEEGWLYRIDGGAAQEMPRPGRGPSGALSLDERGQPWLAVGPSLFRAAGDDWVAESLKTTGSIIALAGVERGRPWALDDGDPQPSARLSSGRWERVAMQGQAYELAVLGEATYVSASGPEETGRRVYRTNSEGPPERCDR